MLKFEARAYTVAITQMAVCQSILLSTRDKYSAPWTPEEPVPKNSIVSESLTLVKNALVTLGASFTLKSVNRLLGEIDAGSAKTGDLLERMKVIQGRLQDELDEIQIMIVDSDHAKYLVDPAPFGEEVDKAFPSAAYDVSEAAKCLALRRSTACVTHLMRSLEVALAVLAKPFNVVCEYRNWQNIIDEIEKGIRNMNAAAFGADWKKDQEIYASAASNFHMLKNGWRNHAMHAREKYTEEQAAELFAALRGFMRHLSRRLSE